MGKVLSTGSIILMLLAFTFASLELEAQSLIENPELDQKVEKFLAEHSRGWYKNYFMDVDPKLKVGGCYTTHNISDGRYGGRRGGGGSQDYLDYVRSLDNYETTLNSEGGGVLISYKRAK